MRTDKQIEASKINGAKSNGPTTPEGKAASRLNGNRHNLTGGHVVLLSNEDPEKFLAFSLGYLETFAPANAVESDLVDHIIAASWRLARISAWECALLEMEMDTQSGEHDSEFQFLSPHARQALTFLGIIEKSEAMAKLHRYQAANRRAYTAAFRALRDLQGDRFNRGPAVAPQPAPVQPASGATEETNTLIPHPEDRTPQLVTFTRRAPENTKLQSEPEPPSPLAKSAAAIAGPEWPFNPASTFNNVAA